MTRSSARKAIDVAKARVISEDVNGPVIVRSGVAINNGNGWFLHWQGAWVDQRWRVQSGGGIAGNSGKWWIAPVFELDGEQVRGPFTSQKALIAALRKWKRWDRAPSVT